MSDIIIRGAVNVPAVENAVKDILDLYNYPAELLVGGIVEDVHPDRKGMELMFGYSFVSNGALADPITEDAEFEIIEPKQLPDA